MRNRFVNGSDLGHSIDSIGWALFFMWIGIVLLANLSWTMSLVGTALIVLAVQATLLARGERLDVFMAAMGVVLLIGAVSDIYGSVWSLFPALLVALGIVMFVDALRSRQANRGRANARAESNLTRGHTSTGLHPKPVRPVTGNSPD